MPPLSYIIIAIMLIALAAGGFPDRLGFSISVWYSIFDIIICLLVVPGAFRIARGLRVRFWVGLALALPGLACGTIGLYKLTHKVLTPIPSGLNDIAYLGLLAS